MKPIIILLLLLLISCGTSNPMLQKDITQKNLHNVAECAKLKENDSLWLTKNTVCVNMHGRYVKVGRMKNNKETGKWYHYYITDNDSLDCYYIQKFRKKDTLTLYAVSVNRNDW